jgi:hypothetical protein
LSSQITTLPIPVRSRPFAENRFESRSRYAARFEKGVRIGASLIEFAQAAGP